MVQTDVLGGVQNNIDYFHAGKIGLATDKWAELTDDIWVTQTIRGHLTELSDLDVEGNIPYVLPLPETDQP